MNQATRYECSQQYMRLIMAIILFGGLSILGYKMTMNDHRGIVINHLIELSSAQAAYFNWFLCLIMVAATVLSVAALVFNMTHPGRFVEITDSSIHGHRTMMGQKSLNFSDIYKLREISIKGTKFLDICSPSGRITINEKMFEDRSAYQEILVKVVSKSPNLRRAGPISR